MSSFFEEVHNKLQAFASKFFAISVASNLFYNCVTSSEINEKINNITSSPRCSHQQLLVEDFSTGFFHYCLFFKKISIKEKQHFKIEYLLALGASLF
jgi:hypothetical protein